MDPSLPLEQRLHRLCVAENIILSGSDAVRIPEQHACQITGIRKIGSKVVSVSVDQRLSLWTLQEKELIFSDQICTDVADIQDMAVWNKEGISYVAVVGEGMAIYKFVIL